MSDLLEEKNVKIFYSWQNDVKKNKNTILNGLKKAQEELKNKKINLIIEQSTSNMTGSPDIIKAIYEKIDQCDFFVCDITIVYKNKTKGQCNSNVMVELGYAIRQMGLDRIVSLFNINSGQSNLLPFDIRNNRFAPFKNDSKGLTINVDKIADIIVQTILNFDMTKLNLTNKLKKSDYLLFGEISKLISEFDRKRKSPYGCIFDQYYTTHEDVNGNNIRGDFEWAFELKNLLNDITKKFSNNSLNSIKEKMLYELQNAHSALIAETNFYNEVNKYEAWSRYYLLAEHSELATSQYSFDGTLEELKEYKSKIAAVIDMFNKFMETFEELQRKFLELSE